MNRQRRVKRETVPMGRQETVRQDIISAIKKEELTAKEISGIVRASEKEVYGHLEHIQKTVSKQGRDLKVKPAECIKCGFIFRKRKKLKRPGKCPVCRGESITYPVFSI